MSDNGYKTIQQRILEVLADGEPHHCDELLDCLGDELADFSALNNHLFRLRKELEDTGEAIVCELRRRQICYRQVKLLNAKPAKG